MLRPIIKPQDEIVEDLWDAMMELEYPHRDDHELILDEALVFSCIAENGDLAGYIWFYTLEEHPKHMTMHALVIPEYRKRFFSRRLLTSVFNTLWTLGIDTVVVEADSKELLMQLGGEETKLGVELKLPWYGRRYESCD